jgi:acetyl esterase/lipase
MTLLKQPSNPGPSLMMRLTRQLLALRGNAFSAQGFAALREEILRRTPPCPAALPQRLRKRYAVEERQVNGQAVITLSPRQNCHPVHILFTHGGAYTFPLKPPHWLAVQALLESVGGRVTVPIYPLAPEHSWPAAFAELESVYRSILQTYPEDSVALCGDSAGGGLALGQALRYRDLGLPLPQRIVLFSPWLDLTLTNPGAAVIAKSDGLLDIPGLVECGRWWAGADDPRSPWLSPIYADLHGLPPIDLFQGSADLLAADARLLVEKIHAAGGAAQLYEYPGAFHDFMVMPFLPESRRVYRQIAANFQD